MLVDAAEFVRRPDTVAHSLILRQSEKILRARLFSLGKVERCGEDKNRHFYINMITKPSKQSLSDIPVRYVKGVGPRRAELLNRLKIETVEDMLYYFPRRYEDRNKFISISKVKIGEYQTIKGEILTMGIYKSGKPRPFEKGRDKGLTIFQLAVGDDTGVIYATWFNQPYMKRWFRVGEKIILYGKVEKYKVLRINTPEFEIIKDEAEETIHTGRIVPIYPSTESLSQRTLRSIMKNILDEYLEYVAEYLPVNMRARNKLLDLKTAIANMHFPENENLREMAYERIVFDEFFILQLALVLRKSKIKQAKDGIAHKIEGELSELFKALLPFKLTEAQKVVMEDIENDMASPKPMNRLLEGDVGSGKTIVAAYALVLTAQNGYQGALMVPTEILAEQHFLNLNRLFGPLGLSVVLLTNGIPDDMRHKAYMMIEDGSANVVIGTHALIQEGVKFKNLGLVVIDEQHKFGVDQRARLKEKGLNPDILFMTATPIPRTLAMTLYGDLDLSILYEVPEGKIPPKAYLVGEGKRQGIYKFIAQEVGAGHQAYIIYPVIKKGKKENLKAATEMFAKFKDEVFPQFNVGLIHGRLEGQEKERAMDDFRTGKIQILVSTTVIEVGIDNPNVSVMLIENPERFGLSQLHQLRGRIGRGGQKSYCILLSDTESEEAKRRLKALISTTSGFRIAEEDLEIRGPGEFFGTRQHGLPELRYANLISDVRQLEAARREAFNLVRADPTLSDERHNLLRKILKRKFAGKFNVVS